MILCGIYRLWINGTVIFVEVVYGLVKISMFADMIVNIINKTVDSFQYKAREYDPPFKIPQKVLIILPNFIGDVVILTPILRNLRYNVGNGIPIDVVCSKTILNLIETLPYINNIYINGDIKNNKEEFLIEKGYDTVFLLNYPFFWSVAAYKTEIKQRIGFTLERLGVRYPPIWQNLITNFVSITSLKETIPQWAVYQNILLDLGLEIFDDYTEINLTDSDFSKAKDIISKIKKPVFSIHASAKSIGKEWKLRNWIPVLRHLKDKYDCEFICTGTNDESYVYDYLSLKSGVEIHNLCGKTSIRETIAIYKYLDLIITLDTAPAHLAAVANTKNIAIIYGPTSESLWVPYAPASNVKQIHLDLWCRPCLTRLCPHRNCLNKMTPDYVINAVDELMNNQIFNK